MVRRYPIALCISNFRPGGAETQFWNLVRRLDRGRFEVHVIQLAYRENPEAHNDLPEGTRVVTIHRQHKLDISSVFKFALYLSRHRIALVQSMLFMDNQFARFAGKLAGAKVVSSIRGEIGPLLGSRKTWFEFRMQRLSNCITANSEWLRAYLIENGSNPEKVIAIHNGIELDRFQCDREKAAIRNAYSIPCDSRLVGIVARLHPMKDHETFFKAIAIMREVVPDVHAVVVGDGERREALESLVTELDLAQTVTFIGAVTEQIGCVYHMLDVLLLTSQYGESFPNVLLEAMSVGVPVIGAGISAVPEIIEDGVNGFIVNRGDHEGFAQQALLTLQDSAMKEALVSGGRETVQHFSVERMVEQYQDLYLKLLG